MATPPPVHSFIHTHTSKKDVEQFPKMFAFTTFLIKLRALTTWNVLAPLSFVAAWALFGKNHHITDALFVVSRMLTLIVTVMFWTIGIYDLPSIDQKGRTSVHNLSWTEGHGFHTLPFVLMLVASMMYTPILTRRVRQLWLIATHTLYFVYIHLSYRFHTRDSFWPYPFMNNLGAIEWAIMWALSAMLSIQMA